MVTQRLDYALGEATERAVELRRRQLKLRRDQYVHLTEEKKEQLRQEDLATLGQIIRSVSHGLRDHLYEATTAKQAWEILEEKFGRSPKSQRLHLLRDMMSLSCSNADELEEVCGKIKSMGRRISHGGFKVDVREYMAVCMINAIPDNMSFFKDFMERSQTLDLAQIESSISQEIEKHRRKCRTMSHPPDSALGKHERSFSNSTNQDRQMKKRKPKSYCRFCKRDVFHHESKCFCNPKSKFYQPNRVQEILQKSNEIQSSNIADEGDVQECWDDLAMVAHHSAVEKSPAQQQDMTGYVSPEPNLESTDDSSDWNNEYSLPYLSLSAPVYRNTITNQPAKHVWTENRYAEIMKAVTKSSSRINNTNIGNITRADCLVARKEVMKKIWIPDSGCSTHMTGNRKLLSNIRPIKRTKITYGNNQVLYSHECGVVNIGIHLKNVLYVPRMNVNLLSLRQLCDQGYSVSFTSENSGIFRDQTKVLDIVKQGNLFQVLPSAQGQHDAFNGTHQQQQQSPNAADMLHKRLGHAGERVISKILGKRQKLSFCESCNQGKMKKRKHSRRTTYAERPLMSIHSDICGPFPRGFDGEAYFVTFVDEFSRFVHLGVMKTKSEVLEHWKFMSQNEKNRLGLAIVRFRCDGGREYQSKSFLEYQKSLDIDQTVIPRYSPELNGIAERINSTLVSRARTMLIDAGISTKFWPWAMRYSAYIYNRIPHSSIEFKTPYELYNGSKPDIKHLRVFGSRCVLLVPKAKTPKLGRRGQRGIYLGSKSTTIASIYCLEDGKIYPSHDFNIDEGVFIDQTILSRYQLAYDGDEHAIHTTYDESYEDPKPESSVPSRGRRILTRSSQVSTIHEDEGSDTLENRGKEPDHSDDPNAQDQTVNEEGDLTEPSQGDLTEPLDGDLTEPSIIHDNNADTSSDLEIAKLLQRDEMSLKSNVCKETEPQNVHEAIDNPIWKRSMLEELASLEKNNTWNKVQLPKGKAAIRTKWVWKIKLDENGNVSRYKSRLVALGCQQKFGRDYYESSAPAALRTSLRLFISMVASNNLSWRQYDFDTAFLNGKADTEIYLRQPPAFDDGTERVLKLNKSIYGLKQAPTIWYNTICSLFNNLNFQPSSIDPCIFLRSDGSIIFLYVDDIIIASHDKQVIESIANNLGQHFSLKELGEPTYILNMQIIRSKSCIVLTQRNYIERAAEEFGLTESKPISTPMQKGLDLDLNHDDTAYVPYRELLGRLVYISDNTRPDISAAVSIMGQFSSNPSHIHWKHLKKILQYLNATKSLGLRFPVTKSALVAYVDANFGGTKISAKSREGHITFWNNAPIWWRSCKQSITAQSSCASEYIAINGCVKGVIPLARMIWEFENKQAYFGDDLNHSFTVFTKNQDCAVTLNAHELDYGRLRMKLMEDNQSCIKLLQSGKYKKGRLAHLPIKVHWVKELVQQELCDVEYVQTEHQLADPLTKALGRQKFTQMRPLLGLIDLSDLQGNVRAAHEAAEESKLDDDIAINETESDRPNSVHA